MSGGSGLDGLDLTQRVVLLGVVALGNRGEAPAHAGDVRRVCVESLDAVDADVVGTLTEAEVARSLNELEADSVIDGSRDETSATGKGRPSYELDADPDDVLAEFETDDRLSGVVSRVRDSQ